ncbi:MULTISPECIES: TlpA disulfide reductase family protein [Corynebacterium]|uniref:TlpA disulfide reductase family protein n=1 Tax=Corynebacterium TaxID=1716 RepID=UPI0026B8AC15|nr:Thiol-disulfide oxidoreductase ResA [Corynebacterium hadale]
MPLCRIFSGPSLMEEGDVISLSDFEGEVVVLNAWGQRCAPCRTEGDDLQLVQETLDPLGGTVLDINVRDYNQTIAQDFRLDNAMTYLSIYDPPFRIATHPRTNRRVQPRAD